MGISRESGIGRKRRSAPPPTGPGSHGDLYLYLYQAELDRTPDAGRRSPRGREQSPQAMTPTPARDDGCVVATRYITTFKWQVNVNVGRHRVP